MKVNSNFFRLTSKKRLVSLSCATALASFALIARPVFAEEVTTDKPTNLDTTTVTTATVETTADLVETHSSSTVGLSETSALLRLKIFHQTAQKQQALFLRLLKRLVTQPHKQGVRVKLLAKAQTLQALLLQHQLPLLQRQVKLIQLLLTRPVKLILLVENTILETTDAGTIETLTARTS